MRRERWRDRRLAPALMTALPNPEPRTPNPNHPASRVQNMMARLAVENGVESYRQQLRWSVRAIRVLEKAQEEEAG